MADRACSTMAPSRETVIDANLSTSPRRSDRVTPIRWSSLRDPTHRVNCPSDHAILTARLLTRRTESTGARPSFATPRTNCTSSSLEASRGDSVPPQEPLHCRDGQALVPVDVRMVLVQAVVERRSLVLGGPMLRPAWLRQRRQQPPAAFLPRKLERWRAWEQIVRQRLHDQADICLIEITQPGSVLFKLLEGGRAPLDERMQRLTLHRAGSVGSPGPRFSWTPDWGSLPLQRRCP